MDDEKPKVCDTADAPVHPELVYLLMRPPPRLKRWVKTG